MTRPSVVIISPATASANNGNWQTAYRWAHHLRSHFTVRIVSSSEPLTAKTMPDAVIALHARRSARIVATLAHQHPDLPIALVLTGTDLYRDIHEAAEARHTLLLAHRLVLLQEAGLAELDDHLRKKSMVIYQSAVMQPPTERDARRQHFDVIMIGHLREEKDPLTYMRAATMIHSPRVRLFHIGGALDPDLGAAAAATMRAGHRYQWLGSLPHADTRQRLGGCDLMVIASRMEGGANVIIEAVTSSVPVLASDISGNRGMLGSDYAGYFPFGDAAALARLIDRAATEPEFYQRLREQCAQRAPLFAPEREKAAVLALVHNLLDSVSPAGRQ